MILRPRQEMFVERAVTALNEHGNTLGVAPTGAGKTVMLSAAAARAGADQILVLQHRDELVAQNRRTYHAINRNASSGVVDANNKDFHRDVVFAMVQTLSRDGGLKAMRTPGLVVVDEAHHSAAASYQKIIGRARELNPNVRLLGVTATPNRGDKKALRGIFDNVCDQIMLGELIASGFLVRPRTFVIDLGVREELTQVRKTVTDFDMTEVEKIMDKEVLNEAVIRHWKEKAGDRRTVVFCSTVAHASHVLESYRAAGVSAAMVTGEMPSTERQHVLKEFDAARIQVLVNVMVLTEGWDCPPVSCVVLLRPSSYKSTMIQMVGRGLRTVDPERYPGILKTDCIVLDFGTSTLTHGSLEQDVNLDGGQKGEAPKKECPSCQAKVPINSSECGICGHVFEVELNEDGPGGDTTPEALGDFVMTEIDLFNASPFKWEDIWGDQSVLVASAFEAWAMAIFYNGLWHAIGGATNQGISHLAVGNERLMAIAAADDYMRASGDTEAAAKSKRWLHLPATDRQLAVLNMPRMGAHGLTRYQAACKLTWKFNERGIRAKLMTLPAIEQRAAA